MLRGCEDHGHQIDLLRGYAGRTQSGLFFKGGFAEKETLKTQTLITLDSDMMGEINAGNLLARRSLEDMTSTGGQYEDHRVMLEAANQGALPSEGPVTKAFTPGNRKLSVREEYEVEKASQTRGRLEGKLKQLHGKPVQPIRMRTTRGSRPKLKRK